MEHLQNFLRAWNKVNPAKNAYAHCDVPCGIYTVAQAETAAETVEKMTGKLEQADKDDIHSQIRFTQTKEEWAEICKRELLILWTDYFTKEHLTEFPDLHEKFWSATKLCSLNKREISENKAKELRKAVAEISEMFNKTKK